MWRDLRYGLRMLRRSTVLTIVVVASLGIAIGAGTAVCGILYSVLIRPLTLDHPEELVVLRPIRAGSAATLSYAEFKALREHVAERYVAAFRAEAATIASPTGSDLGWIDAVSGSYFETLAVVPLFGRTLNEADEAEGARVAMVSEKMWRLDFGADPSVLGRPVRLNGALFRIVGVTPQAFTGVYFAHDFRLAVPVTAITALGISRVETRVVDIIARVPSGVRRASATTSFAHAFLTCCRVSPERPPFAALADQILPDDPPYSESDRRAVASGRDSRLDIIDASRGLTWGKDIRRQYGALLVVLAFGSLVLLAITCANVGILLASRALARSREFATRITLGARPLVLFRQLLLESGELAALGTIVGLGLAWVGIGYLRTVLPVSVVQIDRTQLWGPDALRLIEFEIAVGAGCTLICGLWPIRHALRADVSSLLSGVERHRGFLRRGWGDDALVTAQIALSLTLLAGALLFASTLSALTHLDGGYRNRNVVLARIQPRSADHDGAWLVREYTRLLDALRPLPGVTAVAAATSVPILNDERSFVQFAVPGYDRTASESWPNFNAVTPGFFAATGIGLAQGREFNASDGVGSQPVAIVSEAFARHYFGRRSAIGASLNVGGSKRQLVVQIVGIAHNASYNDIHAPQSEVWYMPLVQVSAYYPLTIHTMAVALRAAGKPQAIVRLVRAVLERESKEVQLRRIVTVGDLLDESLARERLAASLGGLFGVVSLVLVALGLYGSTTHSFTRRIREIGIRMALGASGGATVALFLRKACVLLLLGEGIGIAMALAALKTVTAASDVFSSYSPWLVVGAAGILGGVSLVSTVIPARRASAVDPARALATEASP